VVGVLPFDALPVTPGPRTVLVSRHGRTTGNEQHLHQHWGDWGLSDDGLARTREAAGWWAGRGVDHVVSSPVHRATQTAQVLFGRLDEIDAGWAEHAAPTVAGWTYAQAHARHPEVLREDGWPVLEAATSPVMERWMVVCDRAVRALRRAAATVPAGGTVAVVTHGSLLVGLTSLAGRSDPTLPNLAVAETEVDPAAGWSLRGVHDPLG